MDQQQSPPPAEILAARPDPPMAVNGTGAAVPVARRRRLGGSLYTPAVPVGTSATVVAAAPTPALAAARGDAACAIRLFGAASALFDALGIRTPPPLRPDWRGALRGARSQLVPARANAAWAAGRALTIEQAVTEALAGPAGSAASATPVLPHRRRAKVHVQKRGVKPRGA